MVVFISFHANRRGPVATLNHQMSQGEKTIQLYGTHTRVPRIIVPTLYRLSYLVTSVTFNVRH